MRKTGEVGGDRLHAYAGTISCRVIPNVERPAVVSDQFEAFAKHCGLHVERELLYAAPRDVLHPPSDSDQYFLVTLSGPAGDLPVRIVYAIPLTEADAPGVRDVLWWFAGDAWALEQTGSVLEAWAAHYGYPPAHPATRRLYELHVRQATSLEALLDPVDYRRLMALYGRQVARRPMR